VSGQPENLVALPCWKERRFPLQRKLGGPHSGSRRLGVKKGLFSSARKLLPLSLAFKVVI
jgi:hypothetical protein